MQVFKCALRIMRASFVFPLIYVVGLSFMSVVLAFSAVPLDDRQSDDFERAEYVYSIIDRDNSTISHSLAEALAEGGEAIEVTDDRVAIQDAIAKGHVDYLLIIPEGYEERFLAAENAEEIPAMEAIISYSSLSGAYVDEVVNEYTSLLHTLALSEGTGDVGALTQDALTFASKQAHGTVLEGEQSTSPLDQLIFYLTWGMYPLFTGITVCIGVLLYRMGRSDVRKRNLASPLPLRSLNAQLVLSCLAIALASVAWVLVLGALFFPEGVALLGVGGMAAHCARGACLFAHSRIHRIHARYARRQYSGSEFGREYRRSCDIVLRRCVVLDQPHGAGGARYRPLATRSLVHAGMPGGCRSLHGCGRRTAQCALHRARRDGALRPCLLLRGTRGCEEAHANR